MEQDRKDRVLCQAEEWDGARRENPLKDQIQSHLRPGRVYKGAEAMLPAWEEAQQEKALVRENPEVEEIDKRKEKEYARRKRNRPGWDGADDRKSCRLLCRI